jgi:hypothetical protein
MGGCGFSSSKVKSSEQKSILIEKIKRYGILENAIIGKKN